MRLYQLLAEQQDKIKPRDPNWKTMQDIRKSGAMGSHKDKKRISKNPRKQKYKGKDYDDK